MHPGPTPEEARRIAFYFDGLRYSLSMTDLAVNRIRETLDEICRLHDNGEDVEKHVSSALLDAWSIIDMCHRARELVQSTPTLPQKLPGIQVFLRGTAQIEDMRHYVQHFRSGIPDIPSSWSPLWGSLSWVPTHEPLACYTIFSGNFIDGVNVSSIVFDTLEKHFVARIVLSTGAAEANLLMVAERMQKLKDAILVWIDQHPIYTRGEIKTFIWKASIPPEAE